MIKPDSITDLLFLGCTQMYLFLEPHALSTQVQLRPIIAHALPVGVTPCEQ